MASLQVNISDLRDNLSEYIDLIRFEKKDLNITKRGKVVARLTSNQELMPDYSKIIKRAAGTFSVKNHPEWSNIDKIAKWVLQARKQAERY